MMLVVTLYNLLLRSSRSGSNYGPVAKFLGFTGR
jgi:hypothetical protein